MPDELPEDEEATRTVCLVKNNQPLVSRRSHLPREGNIELAVSVCSYMCSNVLPFSYTVYKFTVIQMFRRELMLMFFFPGRRIFQVNSLLF